MSWIISSHILEGASPQTNPAKAPCTTWLKVYLQNNIPPLTTLSGLSVTTSQHVQIINHQSAYIQPVSTSFDPYCPTMPGLRISAAACTFLPRSISSSRLTRMGGMVVEYSEQGRNPWHYDNEAGSVILNILRLNSQLQDELDLLALASSLQPSYGMDYRLPSALSTLL